VAEAEHDLIPMAALPTAEEELRRLLPRWLPPVRHAPSGEQLERLARMAAQQVLAEDEHAASDA
jgi:hypothetical protein